ncbi:hypothetical protein CO058_02600 [candidate division WWE3 bacterium CG_4_9_14_0_2_um_filter_35_11]|uniref:PIN domain-containing protein n=1 Tax=candidate division WWE3 bacterium CG_4_9_14_0_2_um_filter_35_11 TaxID=1975077 RepID=A0A2M8ELN3_UNCKA|nr:MAG: hypothetical protein COV25_02860 [candidate division WWE3 bacterium CG10_big_fil_rev_8_21_14_0_10_35_32]PJC23625.1 MAG: hypothetical protein CO058_02600 [candidate division WWE3 bacterium CG_4_9_14_0_2_um_filter_35_11]
MAFAIIDTNLLIRFFVKDDLAKATKVKKLLSSNNDRVLLLDVVVAECVWVLSSFYKLDSDAIEEMLVAVIESESVVTNKQALRLALDIWVKENIEFIDAYEIAMGIEVGVDAIYSYDKKLAKVSEIKVKEP